MRYWKKNPKYGQISCGGNMFSSGSVIEGDHWAIYAAPPDDRLIECDAGGNPLSAPPPLPVLHAPVSDAPVPGPAEGIISSVASPASQPAPPEPAPAMSPAPEPPQEAVLGVGDGLQSETTEAVEVPLHTIAPEALKAEGEKPPKAGQPEREGSVAGSEAKAPPEAPGEAQGGKKEASKPSKPGSKPVQVASKTPGKKGGRGTAYV
jgi:hypothetical protein